MKKIFAILLCIMLLCVTPLVAYAQTDLPEAEDTLDEGVQEYPEEPEETPSEDLTEEIPEETPEVIPEDDAEEIPEEIPEETPPTDVSTSIKTLAEKIEAWIVARIDNIVLIISIISNMLLVIFKSKSSKTLIHKLNNNAIAVAENCKEFVGTAREGVDSANTTIQTYANLINECLGEVRKTASENKALVDIITQVEGYLKTAEASNKEFANELAELLSLSNIPNSVKDKLFERHQKAIDALEEQEKAVALLNSGEVTDDAGKEE